MITPPTWRRRAVSAVVSLGLVAGTVALTSAVTASPAAADMVQSCTATMSPSSIRPGELATMTVTSAGDLYLPSVQLVNGHVVPLATSGWNTGTTGPVDYSWWASFGQNAQVANPTSTGYRMYSQEIGNSEVTDSTPFLCEAQVTLLPAAATQSISFSPAANLPLSAGTTTVAAEATSGLAVTYTSLYDSVCTVNASTGVVTFVSAGACEIRADQAGDEDFSAGQPAYVDFYVQAPQTITFAAIADQVIGTAPFTLDVSASSGRYVSVVTTTPSVCAVEENQPRAARLHQQSNDYDPPTVELLTVGTCSLTASRSASGAWLAATPVTRTFKIKPVTSPGVLTLRAPSGVARSAGSVAVAVTSTAAGAITLTSATPAVCAVSGRTATLRRAGTCTVRAAQVGAPAVTASFPVWATPALPTKAKATTLVTVLGTGEDDLTVRATPAAVCRVDAGRVLMLAGGSCKVTVVRGQRTVRTGTVKVAYPKKSTPSDQLELAGTAYFGFDSAVLTPKAKKTLRGLVPALKAAKLVVVYGNTFGPGKNSAHSRALSAQRAQAVVSFLAKQGVKAKAVKVAAAMQNPVSSTAAKNRRADIYVVKQQVFS